MSGQYGTCRSCEARILWIETERGKKMPLDAEPVEMGNVVLIKLTDGREVARYLNPANVEIYDDGRPRFTSHFATCPQAAGWRSR